MSDPCFLSTSSKCKAYTCKITLEEQRFVCGSCSNVLQSYLPFVLFTVEAGFPGGGSMYSHSQRLWADANEHGPNDYFQ